MTLLMRTATAALAALALAVPHASAADGDSRWRGGCFIDSLNDTLTGNGEHWEGVAGAEVVVYSGTHNNVVNATVTCHLRVDGVELLRFAGSGSGAVVFADRLSFDAQANQVVELCTEVDFTSDPTPTQLQCAVPTNPLLPDYVVELLDWAIDTYNHAIVTYVDPAACPVFGGDVYLGDEWLWDCPPYENDPGDPGAFPPPGGVPTGGGWNDGDTGFLALTSTGTVRDVAATCAFHTDRTTGTIVVTGAAVTARTAPADATRLHCVLQDAATGTVVYDGTATSGTSVAELSGTVAAIPGKVTVCTEGSGTWGTETVTVGRYCRPGLAI